MRPTLIGTILALVAGGAATMVERQVITYPEPSLSAQFDPIAQSIASLNATIEGLQADNEQMRLQAVGNIDAISEAIKDIARAHASEIDDLRASVDSVKLVAMRTQGEFEEILKDYPSKDELKAAVSGSSEPEGVGTDFDTLVDRVVSLEAAIKGLEKRSTATSDGTVTYQPVTSSVQAQPTYGSTGSGYYASASYGSTGGGYSGGSTGSTAGYYMASQPAVSYSSYPASYSTVSSTRRGLFGRRVATTCRMVRGADGQLYRVCD